MQIKLLKKTGKLKAILGKESNMSDASRVGCAGPAADAQGGQHRSGTRVAGTCTDPKAHLLSSTAAKSRDGAQPPLSTFLGEQPGKETHIPLG